MKVTRSIMLAFWLGAPWAAQAALVNDGAYAQDTASGLYWDNFAATAGLSYSQVQTDLSTSLSGWQIASETQVAQLFTDSNLPTNVYESTSTSNIAAALAFTSAMGPTITPQNTASQYVYGVAGYFGSTFNCGAESPTGSCAYVANVLLTSPSGGSVTSGAPYSGGSYSGFLATTPGDQTYGTYLVRDTAPVPLPATGWLMLGGVVGLGALARQKRAMYASA
jgi:hypothetical protein